jgi:hypothetical protein
VKLFGLSFSCGVICFSRLVQASVQFTLSYHFRSSADPINDSGIVNDADSETWYFKDLNIVIFIGLHILSFYLIKGNEHMVYKLNKALYGLKQAPREIELINFLYNLNSKDAQLNMVCMFRI